MINRYGFFSIILPVILVIFCFAVPKTAWAEPIGAKATSVVGAVSVISVKDGKTSPVRQGSAFVEGDRVTTGADGSVEIEFDTGDHIFLDKGADLVIKSLHRNKAGSAFSIFNLLVGRVKSYVGKLADKKSKFEYHTRTAIAGVAGTPPWIVEYRDGRTYIYLLGEKGKPGFIYVIGFDPDKTKVILANGMMTIVYFGKPPMAPFDIPPGDIALLMTLDGQPLLLVGGILTLDMLTQNITTPRQPSPWYYGTLAGFNYYSNSRQGAFGIGSGTGNKFGGPPPVSVGQINVNWR